MDELDRWCRLHLGSGIAQVLFRDGYLSTVGGLELAGGRRVVVKLRPPAERLHACATVHRLLFERGYPCAEPLVALEPLGRWVASAETMVAGGELFPSSGRSPAPFARALARLVTIAPNPAELLSLDPPLPWTGPVAGQPELWPWPDDRDFDLNSVGGPAWIDNAGRAARARLEAAGLDSAGGQAVVGHGDWYTANLRWAGEELHVAFDWDSVIAAPEPVVAGLAAAIYPGTGGGTEATVEETSRFLDAYCDERRRPFSSDELELAWAAGLWNRSFDAKKQYATEGQPRSLTEAEAAERRRRAGQS